MAHFDYIKPGGVWNLLSLLSSAIMANIDAKLYKSINGDEGGTWAPHLPGSPTPTPITIGGDGLEVTGLFAASNANITIKTGKFLTVESGGTADFQSGSIITLAGTTTISGPVSITSSATIGSEADINLNDGTLTITSPASVMLDCSTTIVSGHALLVSGGAGVGVANTGNITWQSGALANYQLGSTTTFALGSTLNVNGALTQGSGSVWSLGGTTDIPAAGVVTTHNAATITISCRPTLSGGMTLGGSTTRTSTYQDNLRLIYATISGGSILPTKDVVHIIGDLVVNRQYLMLSPLLSVASDECILKYIWRDATTDLSDAIIVRDDLSTIVTLNGTSTKKGAILVYSGTTARWELLAYSGTPVTDVLIP